MTSRFSCLHRYVSDALHRRISAASMLRRFWPIALICLVTFTGAGVWLASAASAGSWTWKSWERLFGVSGQGAGSAALQAQPDATGTSGLNITAFDDPSAGMAALQGTFGTAINASGEVAGMYSNATGVVHGLIRDAGGVVTNFDAAGAGSSPPAGSVQGTIPTAIDTAGDVAGVYIDANNGYHGFLRASDGTITEFDAPGASTAKNRGTAPLAINDAGQIVGFYTTGSVSDPTSTYHGFLRAADGTFTTIDVPGAGTGESGNGRKEGTEAGAVNASGEIAGTYVDSSGIRHGFVRSASGTYTTFDPPSSSAGIDGIGDLGMDAAGDVEGAYTDSNGVRHGYIRTANGALSSFDVPGATTSSKSGTLSGTVPIGIDPGGNYIVGTYTDSSGLNHAFVYTQPLSAGGAITPFSAPNAATAPGVVISGTAAVGVNISGEVVGGYIDSNNVGHGFVTTVTTQTAAATPTFSPAAGTYSTAQSVTISDATTGATIYYTTNGTTPTTSSTVYSGPIAVSSSQTIEAIATASGYSQSAVAVAAYIINANPVTATPTFTPPGGTFLTAQTVTISDATPGATIYYTTNGTTPTTSSTLYAGPITVSSSETIEAIAVATGYANSVVATATYTINPALPQGFILYSTVGNVGNTFSKYPSSLITVDSASGTQQLVGQPGQSVNVGWLAADPVRNLLYGTGLLSTSSDGTLYTINPGSGTVASQVTLSQSVSAIAVSPQGILYGRSGNTLGTINTATGQFSPVGTMSLPSGYFLEAMTFSPAGTLYGVEENGLSGGAFGQRLITLNPANGSIVSDIGSVGTYSIEDITYATDGNIYATNFSYALLKINPQTASNTLIGIGTIGDLDGIAALAAPLTATPTFSPAPGTYASPQTVALTDATPGATIYYTTNGTAPSLASTAYSGPITVSSSETIEAIAAASGYANSAVAVAQYTINVPPPDFQLSVSPSSLTIARGQSGTATFTVTPMNGFNTAVSFSCSGLPAEATCTFAPASVTPNGSAVTSTLTVKTTAPTTAFLAPLRPSRYALYAGISPFLAGLFAFAMFRTRRRLGAPFLVMLLVVSAGLASCGGGGSGKNGGGGDPGTPIGTSTVTISASATGGASHTTVLTINITQ